MSGTEQHRDAARARLQAVRERFAARLVQRIEELMASIEAARGGGEELQGAIALAHRLAGTAGSFGYVDAGSEAASIEEALRRIASGDAAWDDVAPAVERLRGALAPPG